MMTFSKKKTKKKFIGIFWKVSTDKLFFSSEIPFKITINWHKSSLRNILFGQLKIDVIQKQQGETLRVERGRISKGASPT